MRAVPVVVVHWRNHEGCRETVASLSEQGRTGEILIVDNSADLPRDGWPPDVSVLTSPDNLGYAGGANTGLSRFVDADVDHVLVTSHDCLLGRGALERLVTAASTARDVGIIGPAHVMPDALDLERPAGLADARFVSGSCLMIRIECLRAIGGFDADLGSYCEDVDLAERARAHGWRVVTENSARVATRGSVSSLRDRMIRTNAVVVARRHHGVRAAASEYLETVRGTVRNLAGAVAPWRSAQQRSQSATRARVLAGALPRVLDVVRERPSSHVLARSG